MTLANFPGNNTRLEQIDEPGSEGYSDGGQDDRACDDQSDGRPAPSVNDQPESGSSCRRVLRVGDHISTMLSPRVSAATALRMDGEDSTIAEMSGIPSMATTIDPATTPAT